MKSALKPEMAVLFLFSILISSRIFGQSGFQDGYIVTDQNDSIFGKINAYPNRQNIKYCILRKDDESIKYYPGMMNRFGFIDGACYVSNVLRDTIVQVLVQGKLSLYKSQTSLYIQKEGNEIQRLASFTNRVIHNGEMYYVEDIKWKGTIAYLTSDCSVDKNELNNLRLMDNVLTEFVVKYNKCTKSDYIEYSGQKQWTKVAFGITVGGAQSIMQVETQTVEYYYTNNTLSSFDPSIGIIFTITYPRVTEKLFNEVELSYSKTRYYSSKLFKYPSSVDENYETFLDFTVLSIPVSFNYTLLQNEKRKFYLQGGGDIDFFLKSETKVIKEQIVGERIYTTETNPYGFKKYHAGLFGGVGFQKKFNKFNSGISLKYFYIINSTFRPQFDINTQKISLSLILTMK
jgi:hypothetical protein